MSIIFHIATAIILFLVAVQERPNSWTTAALFILGAAWLISGVVDLVALKRGKSK